MRKKVGTFEVELGRRLREIRQGRGLSREQVGEQLGLSFQQVQKYESGSNRLTVYYLVRLARLYRVLPSELLPDDDSAPRPQRGRQAVKLIQAFETIEDEAVKVGIAGLIRCLSGSERTETE